MKILKVLMFMLVLQGTNLDALANLENGNIPIPPEVAGSASAGPAVEGAGAGSAPSVSDGAVYRGHESFEQSKATGDGFLYKSGALEAVITPRKPPFSPPASFACVLMSLLYAVALISPDFIKLFGSDAPKVCLEEILKTILSSPEAIERLKVGRVDTKKSLIEVAEALFKLPAPLGKNEAGDKFLCTKITEYVDQIMFSGDQELSQSQKNNTIAIASYKIYQQNLGIMGHTLDPIVLQSRSDIDKRRIKFLRIMALNAIATHGGKFYLNYFDDSFDNNSSNSSKSVTHKVLLVLSKDQSGKIIIELYDDFYEQAYPNKKKLQQELFSPERLKTIVRDVLELLAEAKIEV